MKLYLRIGYFLGGIPDHKKHEILDSRAGFVVFSGSFQGTLRGPSLVELTGDDNSAILAVTVQIRISPKEYIWSSYIAEYESSR